MAQSMRASGLTTCGTARAITGIALSEPTTKETGPRARRREMDIMRARPAFTMGAFLMI